jgi:hypothetical protein
MNEEYWTKEIEIVEQDYLDENDKKIVKGGTPTWKKVLMVMILAPKGGILLAPLFLSKFMAGAPWLGLAMSGAFIKKT